MEVRKPKGNKRCTVAHHPQIDAHPIPQQVSAPPSQLPPVYAQSSIFSEALGLFSSPAPKVSYAPAHWCTMRNRKVLDLG